MLMSCLWASWGRLTQIFFLYSANLQSIVKEGKMTKDLENSISTFKGVFDYESFKDMDKVIVFILLVHLTIWQFDK